MSIIVIGAGMAGATVAHGIRELGYEVVVLEARNRIGGRTFTDPVTGGELGGAWIEGEEGNPLIELAEKLKIDTIKIPGTSLIDGGLENCRLLDLDDNDTWLELEKNFRAGKLYDQLQDKLSEMSIEHKKAQKPDVSVDCGIAEIEKELNLPPNDTRLLEWMKELAYPLDWGVDPEKLSLQNFDLDDKDFLEYGDGCRIVPGGMDLFAKKLLDGIKVILNTPVSHVTFNKSTKKVHVKATTGAEYIADRVVVTVPLGVLKAGYISFSPELPLRKTDAIKKLGFGVFEKLLLEFSAPFWDVNIYNYSFLTHNNQQWRVSFNVLWEKKPEKKACLLFLKGGKEAEKKENISDKEIVEEVMTLLRRVFGGKVSEPVRYVRTHWHTDPYSMGAYSSIPVNSSPEDFRILAEPVTSVNLHFAGEATSDDQWQSVHGAYLSGLRVIKEVKDSIGLFKNHANL